MIRYALICDSGHEFESWFRSSDDYEGQRADSLVNCPVCQSDRIEKQIMRPQVARTDRLTAAAEAPPAPPAGPVAMMTAEQQEFRKKLKELRDHVVKNADYVGGKFPELARQMHFEEIDKRSIYGEAKPDEVRSLLDDGVEVQPLPVLPEDKN